MSKRFGSCLCGDVEFIGHGEPEWVVNCHCKWCQKHSGSAFLTYVGYQTENLEWTKGSPKIFQSSPGVERGFCRRCGSTLTFARPDRGEISVFAGSLDDAQELKPTGHAFFEHSLDWLQLGDDAPRYNRHPPGNEDRDTR